MSDPEASFSKRFASRLMLAMEADCITYRDYVPWADGLIARLDRPPLWVCELATTVYKPDALRVVSDFVRSDPPEEFLDYRGEFLGYLWIRYERRELSWASFLNAAGVRSDGSDGTPLPCEYFYSMLNEFEERGFSLEVEHHQRVVVSAELKQRIDDAREVYEKVRKARK